MWQPNRVARLLGGLVMLSVAGCCLGSLGWSAETPPQELRFDLGLREVPDLPEFLRPLEALCRRLIDSQQKGTDLNATHVELSADDRSRLIALRFDLYHDIYCPCCTGEKAIELTDEDLDVLEHYPFLEVLCLDGAKITGKGLAKLSHLKGLRELSLRNTQIQGQDLAVLAALTNLERLNLRGIDLKPEDLQPLVALEKLQELTFYPFIEDDAVLEVLGQLTELCRLPHSPRTDAGLAQIGGLTKLEELGCLGIRITDRGLAHLSGMKKLQGLFLSGLPITDDGLVHLRDMTEMKALYLGNTYITGEGFIHLSRMTGLEELFLDETRITDEAFRHLSHCNRLRWVEVDKTRFTGKGFKYLDPRTPLKGSYGWIPATSDGMDAINRLKSWENLRVRADDSCPVLEISNQPQLKTLHVKLMADAGALRIVDCPQLEKLHINCEESAPALAITTIHLDALPNLSQLELLNVKPESVDSRGAIEKLRRAELGGATNTAMLRALAHCPKLERIELRLGTANLEAVTGDAAELDRLPALKNLTSLQFRGRGETAGLALRLLRNAEALAYLAIDFEEITPVALEPLVRCDRLRSFRLNGRRYTRTFKPDDGKSWYAPPGEVPSQLDEAEASKTTPIQEEPALPTHPRVSADPLTPGNPWKRLSDMPAKLGRFALASDGRRIYRLGGVAYNIRSGNSYGRDFAVFDPITQIWQPLPSVPFGTGGAGLDYWPEKGCLVAIAGIARLGDEFDTDGVTVGIYNAAEGDWSTKKIGCPGLGRVAWLAHSKEGRFFVLTAERSLLAGRNVAILDLEEETLRVVGACPVDARMLGVARTKNTLFVLQGTSRTPSRLHRFDVHSGRHLGSVDLPKESADVDAAFTWVDTLFAWQEGLFVWRNSHADDGTRYTHASELLRMDPTTGKCVALHPGYPGPRARRSSTGLMCGDSFYAFGGQRMDSEWLSDAYQYHFQRKDKQIPERSNPVEPKP